MIDTHLERFATYLEAGLNLASAMLDNPMIAVQAVSTVSNLQGLDKFPLLQVYEEGFSNAPFRITDDLNIDYWLNSYSDQYSVNTILKWVAKDNLIELIETYFANTDRCYRLDFERGITCRYKSGVLQTTAMSCAQLRFSLIAN